MNNERHTAALQSALPSISALAVCASTPAVIRAAAQAGISVIAALPGPHDPDTLLAAGATHLLDTPASFPPLVLNHP